MDGVRDTAKIWGNFDENTSILTYFRQLSSKPAKFPFYGFWQSVKLWKIPLKWDFPTLTSRSHDRDVRSLRLLDSWRRGAPRPHSLDRFARFSCAQLNLPRSYAVRRRQRHCLTTTREMLRRFACHRKQRPRRRSHYDTCIAPPTSPNNRLRRNFNNIQATPGGTRGRSSPHAFAPKAPPFGTTLRNRRFDPTSPTLFAEFDDSTISHPCHRHRSNSIDLPITECDSYHKSHARSICTRQDLAYAGCAVVRPRLGFAKSRGPLPQ